MPSPLMRHFLHGIPIPRRDAHNDRAVAFNLALATQTAVALKAGRLFHAIFLGFCGFTEIIHSLFDIDVAC